MLHEVTWECGEDGEMLETMSAMGTQTLLVQLKAGNLLNLFKSASKTCKTLLDICETPNALSRPSAVLCGASAEVPRRRVCREGHGEEGHGDPRVPQRPGRELLPEWLGQKVRDILELKTTRF